MRRFASLLICTALLAPPMFTLVGCEETISHEESVKQRPDGTSVKEEKTVKQADDGTVTKETEKKVDNTPDR
jgi:hypothetical protein